MFNFLPQWQYELRKFLLRYNFFKRMFVKRWLEELEPKNIREAADLERELVKLGRPIVKLLIRHLKHEAPDVRLTALRALYAIDPQRAKPHVFELINDPQRMVSDFARQTLVGMEDTEPAGKPFPWHDSDDSKVS